MWRELSSAISQSSRSWPELNEEHDEGSYQAPKRRARGAEAGGAEFSSGHVQICASDVVITVLHGAGSTVMIAMSCTIAGVFKTQTSCAIYTYKYMEFSPVIYVTCHKQRIANLPRL